MTNGTTENQSPTITGWLRAVGVFDFLKAWREAFRGGAVVLATVGLMVSAIWMWTLDRLWKVSGAESEPSRLFGAMGWDWNSIGWVGPLIREHWFFGVCLMIPLVFLWSLIGGAILRMLAYRQTQDLHLSIGRSLEFSIQHYWRGYLLAWVLPVGFAMLVSAMVIIYGMMMAIPWVGDLIGGLLFFIPLALGFLLAFGVLVVLIGGHLFSPGVAVGGAHGADAVTSAVSYVLSRPFRAIAYFAMTCLMIWATAAFLAFLVQLAESITTCLISFGEGVWSARGDGRSDKTSQFLMECWLGGLHYIARGAVTCVFFSGSLVSFLLLREAVDGKGRGEVDGVGVDAAPPSFVEPVDTP
ncbi:MAG: hypothetical protein R3E58_09485 [Phycisphaerae bacterium]|nr:hypothetical protein [Phycisphaerales bacterium]